MANIVLRPDMDVNFYVVWSTVFNKPVFWGRKKDFKKWMKRADTAAILGKKIHNHLHQAKEFGVNTRATKSYGINPDEEWNLTYMAHGILKRKDLTKVCCILTRTNDYYHRDIIDKLVIA